MWMSTDRKWKRRRHGTKRITFLPTLLWNGFLCPDIIIVLPPRALLGCFNLPKIKNDFTSGLILLPPTFICDMKAYMVVSRKLALFKPRFQFLFLFLFQGVQLRKNLMPSHDEVDGRSKCKNINLHIHAHLVVILRHVWPWITSCKPVQYNYSSQSDLSAPWKSASKRSRFSSSKKFRRAMSQWMTCLVDVRDCLDQKLHWCKQAAKRNNSAWGNILLQVIFVSTL